MAQQTAVEWLIEQISEKQPNGFYVIDTLEDVKRVFDQAKQMEKEQHYNTWLTAQMNCPNEDYIGISKTFEHYYNETHGK